MLILNRIQRLNEIIAFRITELKLQNALQMIQNMFWRLLRIGFNTMFILLQFLTVSFYGLQFCMKGFYLELLHRA